MSERRRMYRPAFQSMRFSTSYRQTNYGRGRWSTRGSTGSADAHLSSADLESLRYQSQSMDRHNSIFEGILNRAVDNVIATGYSFQMRTEDEELNKDAEAAFAEWADGPCDFYGKMTLPEIERLAFRSALLDGDVGFVKVEDGTLQAIEADLIVTPSSKTGDGTVSNGVQKDRFGRVLGYHVGQWRGNRSLGVDKTRTAFRDRREMMFVPILKRFSQSRGVPALAGSLEMFERLDDYIEATLVAAEVAACQALAVETEMGPALGAQMKVNTEESVAEDTQYVEEMESGRVWYMNPGEKVTQIRPEQPSSQFEPFVAQLLRFAGLALGMPLELVSLDFSRTNYSSARASFLQAFKSFRALQGLMLSKFYRPMTDWILPYLFRRLGVREQTGWRNYIWIPTAWEWVDPQKEIRAEAEAVESGLRTLQESAANTGRYWRDLLAQRDLEIKTAREMADARGGDVTWRDYIPAKDKQGGGPVKPQPQDEETEDDGE